MRALDPCDISAINASVHEWTTSGESACAVRIERVVIEHDAFDALTDAVDKLARNRPVLVLADHTPMQRAGVALKPQVIETLGRVCLPTLVQLPEDATCAFHADRASAELIAALLSGETEYAAIVSVGSGSVTDVAKYARHLLREQTGRRLPFICFPTAASVTAYTSALAVLTIDGAKRTLPALAPDVVICDLQTLIDAPLIMTQAGFGDVLARSVSYGDWFLANALGMDDGFSLAPGKLLEHAEQQMLAQAHDVAARRPAGIRAVLDALLLSGMAMSIAQQTAPLSGWEHAISHFLDLTRKAKGLPLALHGGQVGIGTLISARAYAQAFVEMDMTRLMQDRDDAHYHDRLLSAFGDYDASGQLLAELWRDYHKKLVRWRAAEAPRRAFIERHRRSEIDAFLAQAVRKPEAIARALHESGAPERFADLDVPIDAETAHQAVRSAHLVRARFTLGDLLTETGWLEETTIATLLEET